MRTELTDVHLQDLADVLASVYSDAELVDAIRRFESTESVLDDAEARPLDGFRAAMDTGTLPEILAYLVSEGDFDTEQRDSLEAAFEGSPITVRDGEDGLELYQRISGVADRSVDSARDHLEALAPPTVLEHLETAERDFAEGSYDRAGAEMIRAFDVMLLSDFTDGLEELIEKDLIQPGDDHEHTDVNLLFVVYGYCSMLGGDPQMKGFEASKRQGEFGLVTGQQALYYLVQVLEEAIEKDVTLNYWDYPQ